ncbi:transposon TX1 putative protein, partial [Trifolium medium]|nr:transposon TX1 putative protein [Trifolium medium]
MLGNTSSFSETIEFRSFLTDMDLIDLPVLGRKFTWVHPNGISISRIDRVLVSNDWLSFVCKPDVVDIASHEKLKGLKATIKSWHRETYGVLDDKILKLISEISVLDIKGELTGLSEHETGRRKQLFSGMWHLKRSKESSIVQRSRARWLKEGDTNSSFFHACVKSRRNRNSILALRTKQGWIESPIDIRRAVVSFFRNHFSSVEWQRPNLDGISFSTLSLEENQMLTSPFQLEEIENVIVESDGNKSPGPDGFNFAFVKSFWNLFKGEVRLLFDQFHGTARLPQSFSSYFVMIIPKIRSPSSLGDFRPISLLGCLYKIIAKVLTTRLARVMNRLVEPTQSAFLKGRNLVDG